MACPLFHANAIAETDANLLFIHSMKHYEENIQVIYKYNARFIPVK